jgi:hypothetical protein
MSISRIILLTRLFIFFFFQGFPGKEKGIVKKTHARKGKINSIKKTERLRYITDVLNYSSENA